MPSPRREGGDAWVPGDVVTDRVGIVVVSHSRELAQAAVGLASQVPGLDDDQDGVPIAVAAGTDDGGFGTDATAVMTAIESVASPAGVLVLMDLGSAVLSAEMALEFLGEVDYDVRLTAAPLVEGLVTAVIQSGLGQDLATVAREATEALIAKQEQVGEERASTGSTGSTGSEATATTADRGDPDAAAEVTLVNADGLHARPAATVVSVAGRHDADVELTNLTTGAGPASAASLGAIARLGARAGHRLGLQARGPDATAAVADLRSLVEDAFGEPRMDGPGASSDGQPDRSDRDGDPVDRVQAADDTAAVRGVAPGQAVGPVTWMREFDVEVPDGEVPDDQRDDAVTALLDAAGAVAVHLDGRADAASGEARAVLSATATMARDPALLDPATQLVRAGRHPVAAITIACASLADDLATLGGAMAERGRDVRDVGDRIIGSLVGVPRPDIPRLPEPFVLVADDLAPSDAAELDRTTCVGLVTRTGGEASHTAILARAQGLPAVVVGDRVDELVDGDVVLVDGARSRLVVNPDGDAPGAG